MKKCDSTGCKPPIDEKLRLDGWQQRFVGDERMVKDSCQTYLDLGFEILVMDLQVSSSLNEECEGCIDMLKNFKVVYTRKKTDKNPTAFLI